MIVGPLFFELKSVDSMSYEGVCGNNIFSDEANFRIKKREPPVVRLLLGYLIVIPTQQVWSVRIYVGGGRTGRTK